MHEPPSHRLLPRDVAVTIILLGIGSGLWALLLSTSTSPEKDPFESPYYWWTWLFMPSLALAAGYVFPGRSRARWWSLALVLPQAVALAFQGTVLHDPDHGASLWLVGEMFVAWQGIVAFGAATAGTVLAHRQGRR